LRLARQPDVEHFSPMSAPRRRPRSTRWLLLRAATVGFIVACGSTARGEVIQNHPMATLLEDIPSAAVAAGRALTQSGYAADFSPASLWQVEKYFADNTRNGKPRGDLSRDTGKRLFALGCYVGEVIRRARGGEWRASDEDPEGEINIALVLPDGTEIWPVQRLLKRVTSSDSENLAAYGAGLGLTVGSPPPKAGFVDRLRRHFE
jgi:hypothetical protein